MGLFKFHVSIGHSFISATSIFGFGQMTELTVMAVPHGMQWPSFHQLRFLCNFEYASQGV